MSIDILRVPEIKQGLRRPQSESKLTASNNEHKVKIGIQSDMIVGRTTDSKSMS